AKLEMTAMQANTLLAKTEATMYQPYLTDHAPLEKEAASIQDQIDELHKTGYTNDSSVSLVIGQAIQRYQVTLNAITLDEATDIDGNRALPINLTVTGPLQNILDFIEFFETNQDGSYLVHAAQVEINGDTVITKIVMYLCSPAE
ncbi:MAG: hypothetical protein IKU83_03090, partial [Lachnospiraceae bacterium]|nr:hypothetical protein [Lachnospiraceae bacterium]